MTTESSVVEQLRLQEGRMFQNEKTLALYLDVKAVIFETLTAAARADGPDGHKEASRKAFEALEVYTGEECIERDRIASALGKLGPQGVRDYHAKSLYDCTKSVCKLLWPSQILLVARPKVSTLICGLLKRLLAQDAVRSGAFLSMDPIKQDFLMREAFRRCIVNDCLVVFENETAEAPPEAPPEVPSDNEQDDVTIGPDDSASQVLPAAPMKRPVGARSALGVVPEDAEAENSVVDLPVDHRVDHRDDTRSALPQSVVARSAVAPSVAPKIISIKPSSASQVSSASAHTGVTATSIMRKAINVRKIHIEPE